MRLRITLNAHDMKNLKTIIFWGACWGVLEATLGWLLHLVHFKGEVLILYPIGLMCTMMAFKQSGNMSSVLKVAGVAALVKLSNIFITPAAHFYFVTNPAIAILLEGLATWAFCIYIEKRKDFITNAIPFAMVLMFGSILLFRSWQILMDAYVAYNPIVHIPIEASLVMHWVWRAVVQGLMLVGIYALSQRADINFTHSKWVKHLAFPSLFVAVLLNILI